MAWRRRKRVGGVVARRPVALVAAVVLVLEALGIVLLNWILSIVVDHQQMSLAGLKPGAMSVGAWAAGALFGLYLLLCAAVMAGIGLRDRAPGGFARILLITCAVVHGLIGAFAVGLVGWPAFAGMMLVLALIVLTLVAYGEPRAGAAGGEAGSEGTGAAPTSA
ncbi:hypothetical protein [Streptomyces sp. NPDC048650]|uniref:hypothetical protein n=1 Tax=unclassified Streptomyces TaxID=2593676 RepID=UPI003723F028